MPLKENLLLLAEYNQWMNVRLYKSSSELDEESLSKDQGAFFKSVLGTLNHIVVGDIIWLKRIAAELPPYNSLNFIRSLPKPKALDSVIDTNIISLSELRASIDSAILRFISDLREEELSKPISYKDTKNNPYVKELGFLLQHLFNHQTHHRGQVSTLLTQQGIDIGVTDLLSLIPEAKQV